MFRAVVILLGEKFFLTSSSKKCPRLLGFLSITNRYGMEDICWGDFMAQQCAAEGWAYRCPIEWSSERMRVKSSVLVWRRKKVWITSLVKTNSRGHLIQVLYITNNCRSVVYNYQVSGGVFLFGKKISIWLDLDVQARGLYNKHIAPRPQGSCCLPP